LETIYLFITKKTKKKCYVSVNQITLYIFCLENWLYTRTDTRCGKFIFIVLSAVFVPFNGCCCWIIIISYTFSMYECSISFPRCAAVLCNFVYNEDELWRGNFCFFLIKNRFCNKFCDLKAFNVIVRCSKQRLLPLNIFFWLYNLQK
jgi:hypothetical protein